MAARMGRLTKRNRTKYRRRAYAIGMSRADASADRLVSGPQATPSRYGGVACQTDDRRAA